MTSSRASVRESVSKQKGVAYHRYALGVVDRHVDSVDARVERPKRDESSDPKLVCGSGASGGASSQHGSCKFTAVEPALCHKAPRG